MISNKKIDLKNKIIFGEKMNRYEVEHSHQSRRGRRIVREGRYRQGTGKIMAALGGLIILLCLGMKGGFLTWSLFFLGLIIAIVGGIKWLIGYTDVGIGKEEEWIEQGYNSDEPDMD
jgi:hypothetical protein